MYVVQREAWIKCEYAISRMNWWKTIDLYSRRSSVIFRWYGDLFGIEDFLIGIEKSNQISIIGGRVWL